ncbi:unnamed protein product [Protopolystoma xenopodis]|uniref:Secreted protein n=1 Tax=Protopolystoma xenopodis TaxID=117903 RepID=A0A448WRA4_9PLAT|nr:unnamed protein product [Protopolystoma xenopodis]
MKVNSIILKIVSSLHLLLASSKAWFVLTTPQRLSQFLGHRCVDDGWLAKPPSSVAILRLHWPSSAVSQESLHKQPFSADRPVWPDGHKTKLNWA